MMKGTYKTKAREYIVAYLNDNAEKRFTRKFDSLPSFLKLYRTP